MRRAVWLTVLAALVPSVAAAGVTIHYDGVARSDADAKAAIAEATAFATARGWGVEPRNDGVVLRPHAWCEPVELVFEGRSLAKSWVKTQFAGAEVHIGVVDLFRSLQRRFERLGIEDEGEYWNGSDREKLMERMQSDGLMMVRILEQEPGAKGPYVIASGRIVDVVTLRGDPADVEAALRRMGARLLEAPLVPPRPWRPELKPLAPIPPDRWTRVEAKEERFAAAFPGPTQRVEGGVGARGEAGYAVKLIGPFQDRRTRADLPAAFLHGAAGRILSYRAGVQHGLPTLTIDRVDGKSIVHELLVLAEDRAWGLAVVSGRGAPAAADVQRFFESFEPLP